MCTFQRTELAVSFMLLLGPHLWWSDHNFSRQLNYFGIIQPEFDIEPRTWDMTLWEISLAGDWSISRPMVSYRDEDTARCEDIMENYTLVLSDPGYLIRNMSRIESFAPLYILGQRGFSNA